MESLVDLGGAVVSAGSGPTVRGPWVLPQAKQLTRGRVELGVNGAVDGVNLEAAVPFVKRCGGHDASAEKREEQKECL